MTNILKRISTSFIALSILISLSGCMKNKKEETNDNYDEVIEDYIETPEETFDDEHEVDEQVLKDALFYLDDIQPFYEYANLYPTEEQVSEKLNYDDDYSHETISNIKDEIERVVECIKNNSNKKYKNKKLKSTLEFFVEENGQMTKRSIDLYEILKEALENTFLNATNDIAEDLCVLENVTLVVDYGHYQNNTAMEYKSKDKTIIIYFNTILDSLEISISSDIEDELKDVLYKDICHEIAHARQDSCKHRSSENHMTLNEFTSVPTYIESTAESSLYSLKIDKNAKNHFGHPYIDEREQEALWLLIGVTNPSIDEYYNAIFDADINAFYNFFGLESLDDKTAFNKILYAIDSLNGRTAFIALATGSNVIERDALEKLVGYDYRTDIYRLALKNLAKYTCENPKFSLEENLLLFSLMKTMVAEDTYSYYYGSEENTTCDISMARDMYLLTHYYYDFLGSTYGVNLNDIKNLETECNINYLINLANGADLSLYALEDEMKTCEKLIARFPVLKTILFANPLLFSDNYSFLEKAREVEQKRVLEK